MSSGVGIVSLALQVHNQLSELIAPATPESIRSSSFTRNPIIVAIVAAGVLSFIILFVPAIGPKSPGATFGFFQIIGAAGLGSTFSSLYTASKYVRNSTFHSRYNQIYLIRFTLGVFAGAILGSFAPDLLQIEGNMAKISQTTFALAGGYSAEAVAQILQRFADTLVALVRGSGKDVAEAKADKDKAQKSVEIAAALQDALDVDNAKQQAAIKRVIKDLLRK